MKKKKKLGSSLLFVLMTLGLLMIIGTAVLTFAVSSYKMRVVEGYKKRNLYAAEAGLTEVYEKITQFVQEGIIQGNRAVEAYMAQLDLLLAEEREKVEQGFPSDYLTKAGEVNLAKVEADKAQVFKEGFKTIQGRYDAESGLLQEPGYKYYVEEGLKPFVQTLEKGPYAIASKGKEQLSIATQLLHSHFDRAKEGMLEKDQPIELRVFSQFTYEKVPRKVSVSYFIGIPPYDNRYGTAMKMVQVYKNPAWTKPLVVNGNLDLQQGKVSVEGGDIYVRGRAALEKAKEGGIRFLSSESQLKVEGNVATNENILMAYDAEKEGSRENTLEVKGDIYARNFLIGNKKAVYGAQGSRTFIQKKVGSVTEGGSLYTLDDLEINAAHSVVKIEGGYYGVSDGSEGERNNPDHSSSIIINTPDIEEGTSTLEIGKEVYIAGTSYINLMDEVHPKYQTGESISVRGNYRAYTEPLDSISEEDPDVDLRSDRVLFEYRDPLTLVTRFNTSTENLETAKALLEKERYITVQLRDAGAEEGIVYYALLRENQHISQMTPLGETIKLSQKKEIGQSIQVAFFNEILQQVGEPKVLILESPKELNAFDKSRYFKKYAEIFKEESGLSFGKAGEGTTPPAISIPDNPQGNIHAGTIFYGKWEENGKETRIAASTWSIEADEKIKTKRIALKDQLYYMGWAPFYEDIEERNSYTNPAWNKVDEKTAPVATLEQNVLFSQLQEVQITNSLSFEPYSFAKEEKSQKSYVLFSTEIGNVKIQKVQQPITPIEPGTSELFLSNAEERIAYILIGKQGEETAQEVEDKIRARNATLSEDMQIIPIRVDFSMVSKLQGMMVTKGDLYICGELDFTGSILSNGDTSFEDNRPKVIHYDALYLQQFMAQHYEITSNLFNTALGKKYGLYNTIKVFDKESTTSLPPKTWVEMKRWKLER